METELTITLDTGLMEIGAIWDSAERRDRGDLNFEAISGPCVAGRVNSLQFGAVRGIGYSRLTVSP